MRMSPQSSRGVLASLAMSLALGACAPRVFSDSAAFSIAATPTAAPVQAAVPARIELREKVQFARDSDRILEVSHAVLDEAVAEILAEPRIRKIRVEGHASADGNDAHNLDLSTRRAQAVRRYLTEHGVAEEVLVAEGLGEANPIADNTTPEGRESNRRVELHVIETQTDGGGTSESAP
jgi:outer membrane protein OmpA-like peptidoglycan-associated protein